MPSMPDSPKWKQVLELDRHDPRLLRWADIPQSPGVYVWLRDQIPVYVGVARGAKGLRSRLATHLSTSRDLSRSTLRASVAVVLLGIDRRIARQRPTRMTKEQADTVNEWLRQCEVTWTRCDTPADANDLEMKLRQEWLPELNRL